MHRVGLALLGFLVMIGAAGLATRQDEVAGVQPEVVEARSLPQPNVPAPRLTIPLADDDGAPPGDWVDLADRPWQQATTGWQVLADFDTPVRNTSFVYGPLAVAGQVFERGISTYPFSEISYDLDGHGLRLNAQVGITDDSKNGAGSARFYVYGDEFLLYESDVVRVSEPAREIDLSVEGIRELRLVVDDAGDGSLGDYALWAEPRVLTTPAVARPEVMLAIQAARDEQATLEASGRAAQHAVLSAATAADRGIAERQIAGGSGAEAHFDPGTATFVLGNDRVLATLGTAGGRNGRLSLQRPASGVPTLFDVMPSLVTREGRTLRLGDLRAERVVGDDARRVDDPGRGPGAQIIARFRPSDGPGSIVVTLTLPDDSPQLELRLTGDGIPLRSVRYLDADQGAVVLGDDVQYLSDRSHLYMGAVRPDGYQRRAPLEMTKPALLWSEAANQGLLLAFFDPAPSPAWLSMQRRPGREAFALGVELSASLGDFGPEGTTPPALTIELADGPVGGDTFARFRQTARARYPAAPWPSYARYQWGSWYVYGPGVSAAGLQRQMDLLAANFADLGPWLFAIDAGWYVQYGREDAELTTVDDEKFPEGVRGVTDAVHARGMSALLYLGTGFVHDSTADGGEWLALRGLIDRHPEWLIPFQCGGPVSGERRQASSGACVSPSGVHRFLLDYANPDVRAYLADIIRDFFVVHGTDGILLDGVADAEGQLIPRVERDAPEGPPHPLLPTLDLYRFIREQADRYRPGAFLESGWLDPLAADPYVDVYWYGDDTNDADAPYPFAGFLQRLDYALFSRLALGQRSYVGTASGDPAVRHARWRVQAAAALGAHTSLSYDLGRMTPQTIGAFRADLAAMDPFQGVTTFGPGLLPETFATTRNDVTYLGVVNRAFTARSITVPVAAHGLAGGSATAFTVDGGGAQMIDGDFAVDVPARSFRLLVIRRDPGLLWTDSAVEASCGTDAAACQDGLEVSARGPAAVAGFMYLATPPPVAVAIDGAPLVRGAAAGPEEYAYDEASGLLSLAYSHESERRIAVRW